MYATSKCPLCNLADSTDRLLACMQIISELVNTCRNHDFTDIVIVHEHRGEPDGLVVCHLPYGPTAFFGIYNTVSAAISLCCWPEEFMTSSEIT